MKLYIKPEIEVIDFSTEDTMDGVNSGNPSGEQGEDLG